MKRDRGRFCKKCLMAFLALAMVCTMLLPPAAVQAAEVSAGAEASGTADGMEETENSSEPASGMTQSSSVKETGTEPAAEDDRALEDDKDAGEGQDAAEAAEVLPDADDDMTDAAAEVKAADAGEDTEPEALRLEGNYRDGTYEGSAYGYGGEVTMRITIADHCITAIDAVSQNETAAYWRAALKVAEDIIAQQKTDVDSVSGATLSSDAIKVAVAKALEKAAVPDNPDAFQTGQGTADNPYVIQTAEQLQAFAVSVDEGTTYEGQYIELGADIDLSGIENWNPIGAEGASSGSLDKLFNGSFDGAGHTVSGLRISEEAEGEYNGGLFSTLNTAAEVRNLNITDVNADVTGSANTRIGGLAGDTVSKRGGTAAMIDTVSVSGTITVNTEENAMMFAGGIAGRVNMGAVLSNCWTDTAVTIRSGGTRFAYAGGVAGMTGNNVVIVNAASFGALEIDAPNNAGDVGGIAGMHTFGMWNAYAAGDITYVYPEGGTDCAGALAGSLMPAGNPHFVYYASDAMLTMREGADGEASATAMNRAVGTGTISPMEATAAYTRSELSSEDFAETLNNNLQETYTLLTESNLSGQVTLRNWILSDGRVVPAGEVWNNQLPDSGIFASGAGTAEDPFVIETEEQLFAFAASFDEAVDYSGYTVVLGEDIDVSDKEWTPIGLGEYAFDGTFDGQNHTIKGMHKGTADSPAALSGGEKYMALFGALDQHAVVRNVILTDVLFNTTYPATAYVAGIAGYAGGNPAGDAYTGARIDNCHVSGTITHVQEKGNGFVAGIAGYQYKGAITNCSTDMSLSATVNASAIAEAGGLVALTNRGLVANCYSLGDVYGSGSREGDNEGMAAVSSLVAVNGGNLVGCYGSGNHTTKEFSVYTGTVSGWVTGIGKSYSCWYNSESVMTVNGEKVDPVETIGTKVASGVSEDELTYTGGIADDLNGYTSATYQTVAEKLNAKFAEYPIDITLFGVEADELSSWTYADGEVSFSEEKGSVTYVQPEAEKYVKPEAVLQDGTWFGRDENQTTVVQITVKDAEITATEVLSGETEGEAYEAALEKAKEKATYGDFSSYGAGDASKFAGGSGTKEDPYQIADAEQLTYLSESVNEDTDWEGVWFKQTADISLAGIDWNPIGWALKAEINGAAEVYCMYPFRGNYDGGGYSISDLTIGSEENPKDLLTIGLFGITSGEYTTNEVPTEETRAVELKNIHLKNVNIYGKTRYEMYAGALVGSGQEGILIDRCSVEGGVISGETTESHCRVGGMAASGLRGSMTNVSTDISVSAVTDTGRAYAGGLIAASNRVTIINAYTLGPVTGNAASNNMSFIGGIDGMEGGIHINCYSSGDVTAQKTTSSIGANNGLMGGISVNKASYYNSDSAFTVAGKAADIKATGANYAGATDEAEAKSGSEIKSEAFAEELNQNIANLSGILDEVREELEGGSHLLYYFGDGSDLAAWTVKDDIVQFADKQEIRRFDDVTDPSLFYYDAVYWAAGNGIVTGWSDNTFRPNNNCNRAAVVTFLWRLEGRPEPKKIADFTDLPKDDGTAANTDFRKAISWAAEEGITTGWTEKDGTSTFRPWNTCNRAAIVTFLWRYAGKPDSSTKAAFTDMTGNSDFDKAISWAAEKGITTGWTEKDGTSTFRPWNTCKRLAIVSFLYRFDSL